MHYTTTDLLLHFSFQRPSCLWTPSSIHPFSSWMALRSANEDQDDSQFLSSLSLSLLFPFWISQLVWNGADATLPQVGWKQSWSPANWILGVSAKTLNLALNQLQTYFLVFKHTLLFSNYRIKFHALLLDIWEELVILPLHFVRYSFPSVYRPSGIFTDINAMKGFLCCSSSSACCPSLHLAQSELIEARKQILIMHSPYTEMGCIFPLGCVIHGRRFGATSRNLGISV